MRVVQNLWGDKVCYKGEMSEKTHQINKLLVDLGNPIWAEMSPDQVGNPEDPMQGWRDMSICLLLLRVVRIWGENKEFKFSEWSQLGTGIKGSGKSQRHQGLIEVTPVYGTDRVPTEVCTETLVTIIPTVLGSVTSPLSVSRSLVSENWRPYQDDLDSGHQRKDSSCVRTQGEDWESPITQTNGA